MNQLTINNGTTAETEWDSAREQGDETETFFSSPSPSQAQQEDIEGSSYRSLLSEKNLLPAFVYTTLALQILQLLVVGLLALGVWAVVRRPLPTLVQLDGGESVRVRPVSSTERDPKALQKLVGEVSALLFNWSDQVSVTGDEGAQLSRDPGVAVSESQKEKVPPPAWEASFALAADFRQPFLQKLARLIPSSVWSGQTQVVLEVSHLGEPELLAPGKWKVAQVANLLIFSGRRPTGQVIPFNKEFYLQAIDTPPLPLPEAATPLQQTVHRIRQANLEI